MFLLLCVGLFLPLVSSFILLLLSEIICRKNTGRLACSSVFISFVCFLTLLTLYLYHSLPPQSFHLYSWIPLENIQAEVSFHLDPLSLLMTLIITGVGFLIHLYSIGYMDHEPSYAKFFLFLNFFIFSMLLLVLAEHLLVLFVGWEGVGLASYLLIGFWYQRPAAASAATKAFVINRIGDFGLLLGLLMTFYYFGTGDIPTILQDAAEKFPVGSSAVTLLTLLYFIGATGKSAQIPLQTWLPDAMEGPTPVSALIHAATMVTAGVYLVVRMHTLFILAPLTLTIIGIIGGATALYASICAVGQTDLKKVLAYSTMSQLGLMFLACGIGAFYAAMFHLTTHAFVKALLFLSAGNVVHMMDGETYMNRMGGLKREFPKTNILFLIGVLALSGLPPFAAFFSKELILEQEYLAGYPTLFGIGFFASVLTGIYLIRAYCLTFQGKPSERTFALKEAPKVMLNPLYCLATLSVVGGILGFACKQPGLLESFLGKIGITLAEIDHESCFFLSLETWLAVVGSAIGMTGTYILYTRYNEKISENVQFVYKAFYINEIYKYLFTKPLKGGAKIIDGFIEDKVIKQSIESPLKITKWLAMSLQKMQSGQIRSYIAWMIIGSVLSIVYLMM